LRHEVVQLRSVHADGTPSLREHRRHRNRGRRDRLRDVQDPDRAGCEGPCRAPDQGRPRLAPRDRRDLADFPPRRRLRLVLLTLPRVWPIFAGFARSVVGTYCETKLTIDPTAWI